VTWEERLSRLDEIIAAARAAGNTEVLAKTADLLAAIIPQMYRPQVLASGDGPDPVTRAHARVDAREDDGLHKLRKGRDECTGTRRDGQPCRAPAIEGGLVCRRHGGSAPQVHLKAAHFLLQEVSYFAHLDWQEARGTPREFDALCRALQAQRDLDAYEDRLGQLAELRAEVRRIRAGKAGDQADA
jgi:hypothetical protein